MAQRISVLLFVIAFLAAQGSLGSASGREAARNAISRHDQLIVKVRQSMTTLLATEPKKLVLSSSGDFGWTVKTYEHENDKLVSASTSNAMATQVYSSFFKQGQLVYFSRNQQFFFVKKVEGDFQIDRTKIGREVVEEFFFSDGKLVLFLTDDEEGPDSYDASTVRRIAQFIASNKVTRKNAMDDFFNEVSTVREQALEERERSSVPSRK
jgi:hypothetical protein